MKANYKLVSRLILIALFCIARQSYAADSTQPSCECKPTDKTNCKQLLLSSLDKVYDDIVSGAFSASDYFEDNFLIQLFGCRASSRSIADNGTSGSIDLRENKLTPIENATVIGFAKLTHKNISSASLKITIYDPNLKISSSDLFASSGKQIKWQSTYYSSPHEPLRPATSPNGNARLIFRPVPGAEILVRLRPDGFLEQIAIVQRN